MSSCCCGTWEKSLDWVFTKKELDITNIKTLYWQGTPIKDFNDYVREAHYFYQHQRLRSKIKRGEYIFWNIPLSQGWQFTMMFHLPVPIFWLEANLLVGKKPENKVENPEKSVEEVHSYIEEWLPWFENNLVF